MEDADDLDATLDRSIEDEVIREPGHAPHSYAYECRVVVRPRRSQLGHGGQTVEAGLGCVEEAERKFVAPAFFGEVDRDVGKVSYRLWALLNAIS